MKRNDLMILFVCLAVLCLCLSAVSATDMADNATTIVSPDDSSSDIIEVSDDNIVSSTIVDSADDVVAIDSIGGQNNEIATSEQDTNDINPIPETDYVVVNDWDSLEENCEGTTDVTIHLKNKAYIATSQIVFANNAVIVGNGSSYITCSDSSLIPFLSNNTALSIKFINITFKDATCNMFIQLATTGTNTLENCTFTNIATGSGHTSVVYNTRGFMNIVACNFTNCTTGYGVISNYNSTGVNYVRMNVSDCRFENNSASVEPGCINNCGYLNVTDSTFIGNHATWWAGAIHTHYNAYTRIVGSTFTSNTAGWNGGALFTYSKLEVYNSTFLDNNCSTNTGGGAIGGYYYISVPNITVVNCSFKENNNLASNGRGGAISVTNGAYLDVHNSTFVHNSAGMGQAIAAATGTIDNNTTVTSYKLNIYNNTFINHTDTSTPTVYLTGNDYIFENNTFINSYQIAYTGSGNVYNNIANPNVYSLEGVKSSKNTLQSGNILQAQTVYYVSLDGEEEAGGTSWEDAINFDNRADFCYQDNITVYLADGDYSEKILRTKGHNVTWIGQGVNTIVKPNDDDPGLTLINATIKKAVNPLLLKNITCYNVNFITVNSLQIHDTETISSFYNCTFSNINADNYYFSTNANVNFINCTFKNITANAIAYIDTTSDINSPLNFENCVFIDSDYHGIVSYLTDIDDLMNINNCWYGVNDVTIGQGTFIYSYNTTEFVTNATWNEVFQVWEGGYVDVTKNITYLAYNVTDSYAVVSLVNSTPIVYGEETNFIVKLQSKSSDGTITDFDTTDYPIIDLTYTVNGETITSTLVDGVCEFTATLLDNSTPVTATIGEEVLTLTLPPIDIIINDDNYADYFNEDGTIIDGAITKDTIYIDSLTNKNMTISQALNVLAYEGSGVITNGIITLTGDAGGSVVDGLSFVESFAAGSYPGIAVITVDAGVEDVIISNNNINWITSDSAAYSTAMGIQILGGSNGVTSNVNVLNNVINISGDAPYMYGIDAYSNPWNFNGTAISGLNCVNNTIILSGNNMAEGLYLSKVGDSLFENNTINSVSNGTSSGADVYGFGVSDCNNVTITGNDISAVGNEAGYGVSLSNSVANVSDNDIDVDSVSAIGVGVTGSGSAADITGNVVNVSAGDYSSVSTWDSLGTGNSDVKVTGGAVADISDNVLISNADAFDLAGADSSTNVGLNYIAVVGAGNPIATVISVENVSAFDVANIIAVLTDIDGNAIANATVTYTINDGNATSAVTSSAGEINIFNLTDSSVISFNFAGDDNYASSTATTSIVISPVVKKTTAFVFSNMTTTAIYTARTGEYFVAKLTDSDGKALANKTVQIGFNGATYNRTTDENGSFRLQVNLKIAGGYTFAICFLGDDEYNGTFGVAKITVKKATTKLTNVKSKYTYKSSAKTKSIAATLKLSNGTVVKGKTVKFTVNGKTYSATTNSKGIATVKVSITTKKTYSYTVKFAATTQLAASSTTGKLVIS